MFSAARPVLTTLVALAALGGCARRAAPDSGPSPAAERFAGLGEGVTVHITSDLTDAFAAPRALRPLQVRDRILAMLEEARVPVIRDGSGGKPGLELQLVSLRLSPEETAVWVRVSLAELVRFERRSQLPLMVSTWVRHGKTVVRGQDTSALWTEIQRLTREFAEEYHRANPSVTAPGAPGGG